MARKSQVTLYSQQDFIYIYIYIYTSFYIRIKKNNFFGVIINSFLVG